MNFSDPPRFYPHPLLRGCHRQTAWPFFVRFSAGDYGATQHAVIVGDSPEDQDEIILHDDCPPGWQAGKRVVVLVHGLGGSHASGYMERLAHRFLRVGHRVFRMDMRGCGAGQFRARGVFHADRSQDLLRAIDHVQRLCPMAPITVCGFSLGANLTLKMLAVSTDRIPEELDSVFVVSPPVDLEHCSRNLSVGFTRAYDLWFARLLWRDFSHRRHHLHRADEVTIRRAPSSLYQFDRNVTVKLGGFRSVDEYYAAASAGKNLQNIQVPTVILMAADDPIVPLSTLSNAQLSEKVKLVVTDRGGHLGYYSSSHHTTDPDPFWMDWRLLDWTQQADAWADNARSRVPS